MIDKAIGTIAYAVMSFGGLFGLGDNHYEIPWSLRKCNQAESDVSEEQLEDLFAADGQKALIAVSASLPPTSLQTAGCLATVSMLDKEMQRLLDPLVDMPAVAGERSPPTAPSDR